MVEGLKASQDAKTPEHGREGNEWKKLSAPAAALLATLSAFDATEAAPRADLAKAQTPNAAQTIADRRSRDPFSAFVGRFMQELRKRGVPKDIEERIEDGITIGADEIARRLQELKQKADEELKRRGIERDSTPSPAPKRRDPGFDI